jgi:exosortase
MTAPAGVVERAPTDVIRKSERTEALTRVQVLWLALVGAGLFALYLPTVRWLIDRWTMSVWHNAHGMFIPFIVGYFAYYELSRVAGYQRESSALGFLFVVPALLLHMLDTGIHTQLLSAVSIVVLLPGLSLLFLGRRRTAAIAFPLAFMLLMLPIPLAFTEPVHLVLRKIATAGAGAVIPFLGITSYVEGTTFYLTQGTLHVGDGCSGFSTLYAAVAVAALTAYSCQDIRRRVIVLAAAVPLAIAANVLRVILLIALVHRTGLDVLSTWVHPASGMLTFALSLPVIFWLGSDQRAEARA